MQKTAQADAAPTFVSADDGSRLRLQTIVRLRWVAVIGQLITICTVYFGLGYDLPIGQCMTLIAASAWLNVYLAVIYPARHRLGAWRATGVLVYDILQLAGLLYLTGGIENPFTMLILAPVVVSAATLPSRNTILLGCLAALTTLGLVYSYWPLPWIAGLHIELPLVYKLGILTAVNSSMVFLAVYVWRLARESEMMAAALRATELVLAREQRLHALDGLAAAAAHELGTPLSTIVLTTKEMLREVPKGTPLAEDVTLLNDQAHRCREILQKLTKRPNMQDAMHASMTVCELVDEASEPHSHGRTRIVVAAYPFDGLTPEARKEPVGERRPGVIYGLGNIIENAVDFARSQVTIEARWGGDEVVVIITDDGPGFNPEIIDTLGEPYVTTRSLAADPRPDEPTGLGLGFFIAKTLLERSGAQLTFENLHPPAHGASVRISWPRATFEPVRAPPAVSSKAPATG